MKRGKKVLVIDRPSENVCSVVAAGLFNPITGKFLRKSWMAETLFPFLFEFYQEAELLCKHSFLFRFPIYRPFESAEEQNDWMAQSEGGAVKSFVKSIYASAHWPHQVHNPFGGLLIDQSGYLDVNHFLEGVRGVLIKNQSFLDERFHFPGLVVSSTNITYRTVEAGGIIFCEGARVSENAFFRWLPVKPMKGEVLTIEMNDHPAAIFNRGVYVVPSGGNRYNVGATYQHPPFAEGVTDAGKKELESKLVALLAMPYHGVGGKWGVRPTSSDRRPMLGCHPVHRNVFIFNGLGTKGVSLAPYFANHLAGALNAEHEIMPQVNIQRFYPLYSRLS